ncbi:MAG: DUF1579 domain-containing protein [Thermoguttaceae bacterium]|jgi:hypothetical protein|nr:DUF1579 domain-containing protein [Thermoguttaceae bacterium]
MKRILLLVAAGLACAPLPAAEPGGIPDQVRKGADYLVGQWLGTGTSNGRPATMRMSVQWARGQQYQTYEWSISSPGAETVYGNAVGGLDPGRQMWVEQIMESDGAQRTSFWKLTPPGSSVDRVKFHGEQTSRRDGKEIKAKTTVERKGPDEWDLIVGTTEAQPQTILSMNFKRVRAEGATKQPAGPTTEPTPEDYIQFMKPLVGEWKTTSEEAGKVVPGTMSYRLAPNGHCFLGHYQGSLPDVQSVEGYDPVARKHTAAAFGDDGTFATGTVDWGEYLKPGRTIGKGVTGKQSVRLLLKDGTTTTITATVKCTALDQGQFVLEYSDRLVNGAPQPDLKVTHRRTE